MIPRAKKQFPLTTLLSGVFAGLLACGVFAAELKNTWMVYFESKHKQEIFS